MSRNSSGTYTLPSGNPVVSGTLIEATWANSTLSDIATALTGSLSRSAEGGMLASLRLFDGTSSVPGLAWGSETTTGFYRAGAGDTRLVVTGSQVMQFLSTGVSVTGTLSATGNTTVGGTLAVTGATTLSSTLAVNGATVTVSNSTAFFPQIINRNTTSDANASYLVLDKVRGSSVVQNGDVLGNLVFRGFDGTQYLQGAYINAVVSAAPGTNDMPADLVFGTTADGGAGPSERMRLNNAGNLGLGVTPSAWTSNFRALDVGTTAAFYAAPANAIFAAIDGNNYSTSGGAFYKTNGLATRYLQLTTGVHAWYTAPSGTAGNAITFTQAMTLDASGNLLVGPTSNGNSYKIYAKNNNTNATSLVLENNNGGYQVYTSSGELAFFQLNVGERARIDSSGNLLVGTTTTTNLPGNGTNNATGIAIGGQQIRANRDEYTFQIGVSSTGSGRFLQQFFQAGTNCGQIVVSNSNATAYQTSSDYRLKDNPQPMTGALQQVAALKPCTWTWKNSGTPGQGFIAHELQEVCPDAVSGKKDDVDEDGNPKYQGVDTSFLVATLTAAIQELKAEFDAYKAAHP